MRPTAVNFDVQKVADEFDRASVRFNREFGRTPSVQLWQLDIPRNADGLEVAERLVDHIARTSKAEPILRVSGSGLSLIAVADSEAERRWRAETYRDWGRVHRPWSFSPVAVEGAGARIPEFLSESDAATIVDTLRRRSLIEYYVGDNKSGGADKKGKYGPNYFRFKDTPDEYYKRVLSVAREFEELITLNGVSTFERVRAVLSNFFGQAPTEVASRFIPYTIRDFPTSVPCHSDWFPRDCPNVAFGAQFVRQLAWNIYLEVPDEGGELRVYEHDTRVPSVFDRDEAVFAQTHPSNGDLIVFDSTNVHEVLAGPVPASRITLSGFVGVTKDGRLIFYV